MLHHDTLTAEGAEPDSWILFLHGILGRGSNWRGFARRLVQDVPRYGAILVDLRAHGESQDVPMPDDLPSAARDLLPLVDARPVRAVLGHSFGGKVALELMKLRPVEHLFVVDSLPAARPDPDGDTGTMRVLKALDTMPASFVDRDAFQTYVQRLGFTKELGAWLSQNLDAVNGGGYELGLDLSRVRTLLDDFFLRELWPVIDPPPDETTAHLVIGGRSPVFGPDDKDAAIDVAARHGSVHVHVLPDADHWVHIDDPEGLHAIVSEAIS